MNDHDTNDILKYIINSASNFSDSDYYSSYDIAKSVKTPKDEIKELNTTEEKVCEIYKSFERLTSVDFETFVETLKNLRESNPEKLV